MISFRFKGDKNLYTCPVHRLQKAFTKKELRIFNEMINVTVMDTNIFDREFFTSLPKIHKLKFINCNIYFDNLPQMRKLQLVNSKLKVKNFNDITELICCGKSYVTDAQSPARIRAISL